MSSSKMASKNQPASLFRAPEVTKELVQDIAAQLGLRVPQHYESDFTEMLISACEVMEQVADMDGPFKLIVHAHG